MWGQRPANLWCCLAASLAPSHVRQPFFFLGLEVGWLPATSGQANAYGRLRAGQGVQLLPFAVLLCVQSFCWPEVTIMNGLGVRICPAALWQRCASMLHGDSCGSHVRFPQRKANGTIFIPKGPKSKTVSVNKN